MSYYYAAYKQRVLFEQASEFVGRLVCGLAALHDSRESFEVVRTNLLMASLAGADVERCAEGVLKEQGPA